MQLLSRSWWSEYSTDANPDPEGTTTDTLYTLYQEASQVSCSTLLLSPILEEWGTNQCRHHPTRLPSHTYHEGPLPSG